jgi:hypothetical protein
VVADPVPVGAPFDRALTGGPLAGCVEADDAGEALAAGAHDWTSTPVMSAVALLVTLLVAALFGRAVRGEQC